MRSTSRALVVLLACLVGPARAEVGPEELIRAVVADVVEAVEASEDRIGAEPGHGVRQPRRHGELLCLLEVGLGRERDVERLGLLGFVRMLGPGVDLEVAELLPRQLVLGQHPLHR